jgi:RNA recognition motif-containing protein
MKEKIEYVRRRVDRLGTVSIYVGELSKKEWFALAKKFGMKKKGFGYVEFSDPEPGTITKEMEQMETEQMEQALRNKNFFVGGLSDAAILHYYNKIFSK